MNLKKYTTKELNSHLRNNLEAVSPTLRSEVIAEIKARNSGKSQYVKIYDRSRDLCITSPTRTVPGNSRPASAKD